VTIASYLAGPELGYCWLDDRKWKRPNPTPIIPKCSVSSEKGEGENQGQLAVPPLQETASEQRSTVLCRVEYVSCAQWYAHTWAVLKVDCWFTFIFCAFL